MAPPPPRPTIEIRRVQLEKYRAIGKCSTDVSLAARMGVHRDTVRRTLSGETALTTTFIAGLLAAFPELEFGDLFVVEHAVREAVPA